MNSKAAVSILLATSLAVGLSACGDSQEAPKDTWKDYVLADGGFTVKVPSDPVCQQQDVGNGIKATMCTAETENTGMMISTTKLPSVVPPGNVDKAVAGAMAGSAKNMEGKVVNPVDVESNGFRGKDFSVTTAKGDMRSRIFIKGSYLIQAMGIPKGDPAASKDDAEKFVTSLSAKTGG